MCRIELAPRLWLQGAELTITGGSGSSEQASIWAEFRLTLPWLQITALGWPVEPEVKRYLAGSPGRALAISRRPFSISPKLTWRGPGFFEAITGRPARPGCDRPSAN